MTTDEKKAYLKSYESICVKIRTLEEQKKSIMETVIKEKVKSPGTEESKKTISENMIYLESIMKMIDQKNVECLEKKIRIESAIVSIENGIECDLLRMRYLMLYPWNKICLKLGYEWAQVHRIHNKALVNINL